MTVNRKTTVIMRTLKSAVMGDIFIKRVLAIGGCLLVFLLLAGGAGAVRITHVDVPSVALAGDDVHLECHYQEEEGGESSLYTLKWYKDTQEFYSHQPGISAHTPRCPQEAVYHVPGVTVDCWGSTERNVVLQEVSSVSSGNYSCEVTADRPTFRKEKLYGVLNVFNEALKPPELTQGTGHTLASRDHRTFTCLAQNSEYSPDLQWVVNGHPANQSWVRQVGQRETGLVVPVLREHFPEGVMRVDCQASISAHHRRAAHLKLNRQDHLSAQEYHYNAAHPGPKEGGWVVAVAVAVAAGWLLVPRPLC